MASILRVDTLTDASSNNSVATSFVAGGSAKAWINMNGTGTIATNDSLNISGTTDNGTGDYTITINSNMNNDDFSHIGVAHFDDATNGIYTFGLPDNVTFSDYRTTGLVRYEAAFVHATSNRTNFDSDECCVTIHGDLA